MAREKAEEVSHGRRQTDREPNRGWRPVVGLAVGVAIVDWTTKAWIAGRVPLEEMVIVWPGRVAFWHVRNPALVLGLFGDLPLGWRMAVAILLGIAAGTLLLQVVSRAHRLLPKRRPWAWLFAGLLLGGLLGNLGERVVHRWVTDFLSFRWGSLWLPPGNVADLAVIASIPISLLVIAFEIEARSRRGRARAPTLAAEAPRPEPQPVRPS